MVHTVFNLVITMARNVMGILEDSPGRFNHGIGDRFTSSPLGALLRYVMGRDRARSLSFS